jgi:hypothetical protein
LRSIENHVGTVEEQGLPGGPFFGTWSEQQQDVKVKVTYNNRPPPQRGYHEPREIVMRNKVISEEEVRGVRCKTEDSVTV